MPAGVVVSGYHGGVPSLPPVVLLTDVDGTVLDASANTAGTFGEACGRRCTALVGAVTEGHLPVCTDTCMYEEPRDPMRVRAGGKSWRMTCAAAGERRVVVLEPLAEPSGEGWVSPREREVLALIAEGLTNVRIGRRLGLSKFTVRTHVEHLLEKLHVRTRTAAVARAIQLGILPG